MLFCEINRNNVKRYFKQWNNNQVCLIFYSAVSNVLSIIQSYFFVTMRNCFKRVYEITISSRFLPCNFLVSGGCRRGQGGGGEGSNLLYMA